MKYQNIDLAFHEFYVIQYFNSEVSRRILFRCGGFVGGFCSLGGLVLGDFLLLELGHAGGDELVVPGEEFADVGIVDLLAVEVGKDGGEELAHGLVAGKTLDVDGFAALDLVELLHDIGQGLVAVLGVHGDVGQRDYFFVRIGGGALAGGK